MPGEKKSDLAESAREFVGYLLVSVIALMIDYGIYWTLALWATMSLPASAVVAYTAGLIVAYILLTQKIFVNGWLRKRRAHEAALFALSGLLGVGLTYLAVALVVEFFGKNIHAAKLVAIGVSFLGVYVFRKRIVFRVNENAE